MISLDEALAKVDAALAAVIALKVGELGRDMRLHGLPPDEIEGHLDAYRELLATWRVTARRRLRCAMEHDAELH